MSDFFPESPNFLHPQNQLNSFNTERDLEQAKLQPSPIDYETTQLNMIKVTLCLSDTQLAEFQTLVEEGLKISQELVLSEDTIEDIVARLSSPEEHTFFREQLAKVLPRYTKLVVQRLKKAPSPLKMSNGTFPKFPQLRTQPENCYQTLNTQIEELIEAINEKKQEIANKQATVQLLKTRIQDELSIDTLSESLKIANQELVAKIQSLEDEQRAPAIDQIEQLARKRQLEAIKIEQARLKASILEHNLPDNPFTDELQEKVEDYLKKRRKKESTEAKLDTHECGLLQADAKLIQRNTALKHEFSELKHSHASPLQYFLIIIFGGVLAAFLSSTFPNRTPLI